MTSPARQRAAFYRDRAVNYRNRAILLLELYRDRDSAGALIYEAAKQCINAVANQRGANPATTGAKLRSLNEVAAAEAQTPDLSENWYSALQLHIHADRGLLNEVDFLDAWDKAQTFISQMLAIYGSR